jgi:hypothetical protein
MGLLVDYSSFAYYLPEDILDFRHNQGGWLLYLP